MTDMETLHIGATKNSPEIRFDTASGTFSITGNSIPENANEFYTPVIAWLERNLPSIAEGSAFEFRLPYFNSSSMKALYMVLLEVKKEMDKGRSFQIHWYVEEDDEFMIEAAETFNEMLGMEITVKNG
jgi:hypothetical protein